MEKNFVKFILKYFPYFRTSYQISYILLLRFFDVEL